jgi:hypothetical protein
LQYEQRYGKKSIYMAQQVLPVPRISPGGLCNTRC